MTARVNLLAVALAMTIVVCAQEPELKVKPSGRILFDAAYINSSHQEDELKSGVGIPDMRVGVGFTYDKWKGNCSTVPLPSEERCSRWVSTVVSRAHVIVRIRIRTTNSLP